MTPTDSTTGTAWALGHYDAEQRGPIFGVSDDGDAVPEIVRAFLDSPKAKALEARGLLSCQSVGACIDVERMSAAGELPVGPEEYRKAHHAVAGRVPLTTNVGTVVLPRFYRPPPFVVFPRDVHEDLEALLKPFLHPPGGQPRPIVVYVFFPDDLGLSRAEKADALRALATASPEGAAERLGLLQRVHGRGSAAPEEAIDITVDAGLRDVMIEGDARFESQDQLLLPGLLTYFTPARVNAILSYAQKRSVNIVPKHHVDVETAARTIWAGQTAAQTIGMNLAKFGLFPLTLEQQIAVITRVRPWLEDFTPAPAFYVDRPIVTAERVYTERELVEPLKTWIEGTATAGADVVLIDSPDRTPAPAGFGAVRSDEDNGRRLIKRDIADTSGVLTLEDLQRVDGFAREQSPPVRIMWAGGLNGRQAFELARMPAFAIFTTSTTARRVALADPTRSDPASTSQMEPRYLGVLAVRMVIEAGFLSAAAAKRGAADQAEMITVAAEPVIGAVDDPARPLITAADGVSETPELVALRQVLEPAWGEHISQTEDDWR